MSENRRPVYLREWREAMGLSQGELAERAGIQRPTVNAIENGRQPPRPTTMRKLAEAMGLPPVAFYLKPSEANEIVTAYVRNFFQNLTKKSHDGTAPHDEAEAASAGKLNGDTAAPAEGQDER